jgi:hypothetical protein
MPHTEAPPVGSWSCEPPLSVGPKSSKSSTPGAIFGVSVVEFV